MSKFALLQQVLCTSTVRCADWQRWVFGAGWVLAEMAALGSVIAEGVTQQALADVGLMPPEAQGSSQLQALQLYALCPDRELHKR